MKAILSSKIKLQENSKKRHTTYTLMKRPHYIQISSLLPQSTAVLSHFGACSKRLETFSPVLHRKTRSLNMPTAVKFLLFGNYETRLEKISLVA